MNLFCICSVQTELQQDTKKTVDLIDTLEQQSVQRYHAEPNPEMPYIPPNTQLSQKGGYLFIRRYRRSHFIHNRH